MTIEHILSTTAAELADGRVLVISSRGQDLPPSAELWDPATNAWTTIDGPGSARTGFGMVALQDGRALVIGGLNEGGTESGLSYSSAVVFDPAIGVWTKVGLMHQARTAPSAVVLADGRVLVAGGYFNTGFEAGGAIELAAYTAGPPIDPEPSPPPPGDATDPAHGHALATAEIFDPQTGEWSTTGPMAYARAGAAATRLADGRVLIFGDKSGVTRVHPDAYVTAELYDPATGRFTMAGSLPRIDRAAIEALGVRLPDDEGEPNATETLIALPDRGAVLVGSSRYWKHQASLSRTLRFDPDAETWRAIGQPCAWSGTVHQPPVSLTPGVCRERELVAGPANGRILAVGGHDMVGEGYAPPTADARLLDPVTGGWTATASMPRAWEFGGTAVALRDGSVLVFGGSLHSADPGAYDPEVVRWIPSP
jgi:hypothetical protein